MNCYSGGLSVICVYYFFAILVVSRNLFIFLLSLFMGPTALMKKLFSLIALSLSKHFFYFLLLLLFEVLLCRVCDVKMFPSIKLSPTHGHLSDKLPHLMPQSEVEIFSPLRHPPPPPSSLSRSYCYARSRIRDEFRIAAPSWSRINFPPFHIPWRVVLE